MAQRKSGRGFASTVKQKLRSITGKGRSSSHGGGRKASHKNSKSR